MRENNLSVQENIVVSRLSEQIKEEDKNRI